MELPLVTQVSLLATSAGTQTSTPTGLTALHLAVVNNNRGAVRALLLDKEHAIDSRTPTGATPLMLASLYGRFDIFIYLIKKSASVSKKDYAGFDCFDYVRHLAFTKRLLEKYDAAEKPHRSGRKAIYKFLRPFASIPEQSRLGRNRTNNTLPALSEQKSERRTVLLRRGGVFEIVEVRSLALAEWGIDLGRKTW